jgi:hypothetical protein
MKKAGLLVASLVLIWGVTDISAQAVDRRDGNWWIRLAKADKAWYVIGFFDGMELGFRFSYWGIKDEKKIGTAFDVGISYSNYLKKYLSNVTSGQLVDGLDSFYSDFRNRRISMHGAVWLVVNSIVGTPKEELDKMIEGWRKDPD